MVGTVSPWLLMSREGVQMLTLPPVRLQSSLRQRSPLLVLGSLTGRRGRGTWGHTRVRGEAGGMPFHHAAGSFPSPGTSPPDPPVLSSHRERG